MKKSFFALVICLLLASCAPKNSVVSTIVSKQQLEALTPDSVLNILMQGNSNFVNKTTTTRDINAQLKQSSVDGQAPLAIVLSCIDARVPVEMIFDMGLGDIFVTRVAGNIINPDVLGSMEYATEHTGSKLVMVLGHSSCGAVHAACEGAQGGNMTQMLANIKPSIEKAALIECDIHSHEFQDEVVEQNVRLMMERARSESDILKHLEAEGKIKIVGGVFDLSTGKVYLL